jgi:hypothetical protein
LWWTIRSIDSLVELILIQEAPPTWSFFNL